MNIEQYCTIISNMVDRRFVEYYEEHLMHLLRSKINYKLYIEHDIQHINYILAISIAMDNI